MILLDDGVDIGNMRMMTFSCGSAYMWDIWAIMTAYSLDDDDDGDDNDSGYDGDDVVQAIRGTFGSS